MTSRITIEVVPRAGKSAAARAIVAAAEARGETVLHAKRGRPTRDLLRSIDADALAGVTWAAAWARYTTLAHALSVHATRNGDAAFSLLVKNVRWVHGLALGLESVVVAEAEIDLDAIEESLHGVDVPDDFTIVLTAARARLTLDAGKSIELAPLAALAGVSLGTVRAAVASGAEGAEGRTWARGACAGERRAGLADDKRCDVSKASIELDEGDVTRLLTFFGYAPGPVVDVSVLRKEQRWTKTIERGTRTLFRYWSRGRDPSDEEHAPFAPWGDEGTLHTLAEVEKQSVRELARIALAVLDDCEPPEPPEPPEPWEKRRRDRELVAAGVRMATGNICGVGDEEADRLIAQVDAMLKRGET